MTEAARSGPTLGTLLRHLAELLDGEVEAAYRDAGLDYRPRYTPVVRLLTGEGPSTIRAIARFAGITHSAASQTVAEMVRRGLAATAAGRDGRERIVRLTPAAEAMLPALRRQWAATNEAAAALEAEIALPLHGALAAAIAAVEAEPFGARIAAAAARIAPPAGPLSAAKGNSAMPTSQPSSAPDAIGEDARDDATAAAAIHDEALDTQPGGGGLGGASAADPLAGTARGGGGASPNSPIDTGVDADAANAASEMRGQAAEATPEEQHPSSL